MIRFSGTGKHLQTLHTPFLAGTEIFSLFRRGARRHWLAGLVYRGINTDLIIMGIDDRLSARPILRIDLAAVDTLRDFAIAPSGQIALSGLHRSRSSTSASVAQPYLMFIDPVGDCLKQARKR